MVSPVQNNFDQWIVHIYAVVRMPIAVPRGAAVTPEQAAVRAEAIFRDNFGLRDALYHSSDPMAAEDAEEITGFMVDAPGDLEYEKSVFLCADGVTRSPDEQGRSRCEVCGRAR
jgi:hypothetical protein